MAAVSDETITLYTEDALQVAPIFVARHTCGLLRYSSPTPTLRGMKWGGFFFLRQGAPDFVGTGRV